MLCVAALLALGVVMVQSSGMSVTEPGRVSVVSLALTRHAGYMAVALAAMAVAALVPVERLLDARSPWRGPAWLVPAAFLLCLAPYAPGLGREVNGAARWIAVTLPGAGRVSVQPSELAKWAAVVFCAWFGAWRGGRIRDLVGGLGLGLAPVAALAALILLEDLGTAALIGAVAVVVLVAAGVRLGHAALLAPIGLAAVALGILAEPYRIRRLAAFVDPFADPQGAGYHAIQSMSAIAGGGGFGRGLGFGVQKFGYLPEDQTDFIFAIITEELGVVGAVLTLSLLAGLVWACWRVAARERSPAVALYIVGVTATVGLQTAINLLAVTGLGPTKGIALPLVSAGGTGWIATAAALGVVVRADRRQALDESETGAVHPDPPAAPATAA
ncbi:MAG: stage V sporulation protein E [Planctomycetota bacterium]|nr:MAG: stage V sporulation protein E [Planctomycetota bacterium]